ncbi:MAG: CopG family transcriptional regulator [Syntrophomonas sp.]
MATDKFEHATFYLTKSQVDDIREMARKNQISRSALVRMIIREFLAKQADTKSQ